MPRILDDLGIHVDFPVDVDDENMSEQGFQPTLPGEITRLSSALALFQVSRILSKVLNNLYPTTNSPVVPARKIESLNDDLESWLRGLPAHLRLQFVQETPSAQLVGSRSPFLVSDA